jgi:hypothetical protein
LAVYRQGSPAWLAANQIKTICIEPGGPQQKGLKEIGGLRRQ